MDSSHSRFEIARAAGGGRKRRNGCMATLPTKTPPTTTQQMLTPPSPLNTIGYRLSTARSLHARLYPARGTGGPGASKLRKPLGRLARHPLAL